MLIQTVLQEIFFPVMYIFVYDNVGCSCSGH